MIRLTEPSGKEAELFRNLPNGRVQCTACARYCQIGEGQIGLCGIRGVVNGKLYLLNYGKVIVGHIDPIEKKPVIHYRPGSKIFSIATTGCNWLCHSIGSKILLADGSKKNVEDLLVGDTLWSYDLNNSMKITPNVITHLNKRFARLWEVRYGTMGDNRMLITEEHPIFTQDGWKMVRDLKKGDMILKVWNQNTKELKAKRKVSIARARFNCKVCNKVIIGLEEWNRHRAACYTRDIEIPEHILEAKSEGLENDNPVRDPEVKGRALSTSNEGFLNDPEHGWHTNVNGLRFWLYRHPSAYQQRLYEILNDLRIDYEKEYKIQIDKRLDGSKAYYIADAAFPDSRLDIEVDGWWHYNSPEVKDHDRIRDLALKTNGWDVLRISGSYLFDHPEEVKTLILEHLNKPIMKNRKEWVKVYSVKETNKYDVVIGLETIPNHNYVADGILVHNCRYCQNFDISQRRKIEGKDFTPEQIANYAKRYSCEGIAYTYNQPTIFIEYARDVGLQAHKLGMFNIFVSNGFDTPDSVKMMESFLDCITVDFKGSGETEFVRKYIGIPSAEPIFQTLIQIRDTKKIHIEITDLIVPNVGDKLDAAEKLCKWVYDNLGPDVPVHFLRFHPDYLMMDFPWTPIETLEKHYEVAKKVGLRYVYIGNVPGHPAESTYCPGCGNVLIGRYGYEITSYNLDEKNRCIFCGYKTPIIGPLSKSYNKDRFMPVID